jgi:hypothetical protein
LLACSTSTREWAIGGHPGGHAENMSQPGGNLRRLKMSVASNELGKIDWNRLARTCRSHCRRARSRHSPPNEGADAVGGGGWRGMSRRNSCIGLPRPTSAMEGDPTRASRFCGRSSATSPKMSPGRSDILGQGLGTSTRPAAAARGRMGDAGRTHERAAGL